jgi:hypothetical protein
MEALRYLVLIFNLFVIYETLQNIDLYFIDNKSHPNGFISGLLLGVLMIQ